VDDALDMLMEDVDKVSAAPKPPPKPPPKETPAKAIRRLADVPDRYWVSKRKVEALVRKKVSARVRLPRAKASMRIKFNLDLAPLAGIQAMCEEAGLELTQWPRRCGSTMKRVWKAAGPAATARFAQLNKAHPLGWGGAKLTAAPKASKRKVSRAMALLAPPLQVEHRVSQDQESATISAYLVTYNEEGTLGMPSEHEKIWGDATEATERALKKYAKRMLGEMFVEQLPVSQTFMRNLGTQYYDSCDEDSDSNWSEGDDN